MPDARRIYWDSCAWIGLVNLEPGKSSPLRSIWEASQRGQYQIWTSTYAYLELQYGVTPFGEPYPSEEGDAKFEALLVQDFVRRVQFDTRIAKLARKLKREWHSQGLSKRSDAIHLATAVVCDCEELHTWDGRDLLHLDGKVVRPNGTVLRILKPGLEYDEAPLFAGLTSQSEASGAIKSLAIKGNGADRGRITTVSSTYPFHELVSYVAPGSAADIYVAAAGWVDRAEREGREERYRIEVPGRRAAELNGVEVKAIAQSEMKNFQSSMS